MRQILFDPNAIEDLEYWIKENRKKALKILKLIQESGKDPFHGTGKPEPLKYELKGCCSRRIDQEHRLVYEVQKNIIRILACQYHY
ncbi:MAG: Txe/YoeB family addiction module toxin [Candidatus Marinimicrobia bacterium]|nr:Txe/YoeB family addiction module toxin [Candidatus Neomarinimicrobiota bacterium]MDP6610970.1 Txe/YoeB family addiction module toxin [Candidatus Neomarinimicrobiota bacterium]